MAGARLCPARRGASGLLGRLSLLPSFLPGARSWRGRGAREAEQRNAEAAAPRPPRVSAAAGESSVHPPADRNLQAPRGRGSLLPPEEGARTTGVRSAAGTSRLQVERATQTTQPATFSLPLSGAREQKRLGRFETAPRKNPWIPFGCTGGRSKLFVARRRQQQLFPSKR